MIADVVVVGGGFWGTAVAVACSAAGRDVVVLDSGYRYAASPAAAGIVRWEWYDRTLLDRIPDWWTDEHLTAGRDLLDRAGTSLTTEMLSTRRNREPRPRPGLWLVDSPQAVLGLFPKTADSAVKLRDRTVLGLKDEYRAREAVVVAAGARTDELLRASGIAPLGVTPLRGRGFLVSGIQLDYPRTFMGVPYRHLTFRPTVQPGLVRVGDTVEQTPNSRPKWTSYVEETIRELYPRARIVSTMEGERPILPKFTVDTVAPGVIVATGGHRVGLGLAGGVGKRAVELLAEVEP